MLPGGSVRWANHTSKPPPACPSAGPPPDAHYLERRSPVPAVSEKQRKFFGAELARKRAGQQTTTGMSEKQLTDFAKSTLKPKQPAKPKQPKTDREPWER